MDIQIIKLFPASGKGIGLVFEPNGRYKLSTVRPSTRASIQVVEKSAFFDRNRR